MRYISGLVFALAVGSLLGCSENDEGVDSSRIGQPCGDEGYPLYCESEQVLIECYKCNDFTSNTCWKKIGCGPEYKCRYVVLEQYEPVFEGALCISPTDPRYPSSTSSPQTFEK